MTKNQAFLEYMSTLADDENKYSGNPLLLPLDLRALIQKTNALFDEYAESFYTSLLCKEDKEDIKQEYEESFLNLKSRFEKFERMGI